jgi:VIT1/CCC1 family predicted Fe2+/Mn2+ transporter
MRRSITAQSLCAIDQHQLFLLLLLVRNLRKLVRLGRDTLAREELGIDPGDLGGSAWAASILSFFVFMLGAIVPVAPFFFLHGATVVLASVGVSALALFLIGTVTTLFTGRNAVFAGSRQAAIGLLAAAVTYSVGRLIGVAVGG